MRIRHRSPYLLAIFCVVAVASTAESQEIMLDPLPAGAIMDTTVGPISGPPVSGQPMVGETYTGGVPGAIEYMGDPAAGWQGEQVESQFATGGMLQSSPGPGRIRLPRFETYFKMGPTFLMGDGYFANDSNVGYQITAGMREPLLPNRPGTFFDFGGSYTQASGDDTRTRNVVVAAVSPIQVFSTADDPDQDNRANVSQTTKLEDLRRGSIHAAVGWRTIFADGPNGLGVGSMRIGGRVGHVRGSFEDDAAATAEIARLTGVADAVGFESFVDGTIIDTDTYGGIFAGFETTLARQVSRTYDVAFTLDAEISNDWIELKGFEKRGLATVAVLFGLSVSR